MTQTRRKFLAGLIGGVALTGCATSRRWLGIPDKSPPADDTITLYPFRREDVEALGVPCLGVTLDQSTPGLMFLTRYEANHGLRWEAPNHYSLVTRAGRLVTTKGLRRDLVETRFETVDPLFEVKALTPALSHSERGEEGDFSPGVIGFRGGQLVRRLDLIPGDHQNVRCISRLEPVGEEFLAILEREYRALRIREYVEVGRWQWKTENTYWVEVNSGAVIRSIQQITPDTPRIVIDLLKAPA